MGYGDLNDERGVRNLPGIWQLAERPSIDFALEVTTSCRIVRREARARSYALGAAARS